MDTQQRSIEETIKGSTNTQMLKLVCIKVLDPKNLQNMNEFTILRVPVYALEGIKANYGSRVHYTTKGAYKHFVNDVRKQNHKGTATSIGASGKEIRYASILKKEVVMKETFTHQNDVHIGINNFTFPAYKEGNDIVMTSDLKEADRNEKIHKGIHDINNCRKLTKSRKRTPKGIYTPTGLPIINFCAYDIIAETYRKAGKSMPVDHQRDRERTESRKANQ